VRSGEREGHDEFNYTYNSGYLSCQRLKINDLPRIKLIFGIKMRFVLCFVDSDSSSFLYSSQQQSNGFNVRVFLPALLPYFLSLPTSIQKPLLRVYACVRDLIYFQYDIKSRIRMSILILLDSCQQTCMT